MLNLPSVTLSGQFNVSSARSDKIKWNCSHEMIPVITCRCLMRRNREASSCPQREGTTKHLWERGENESGQKGSSSAFRDYEKGVQKSFIIIILQNTFLHELHLSRWSCHRTCRPRNLNSCWPQIEVRQTCTIWFKSLKYHSSIA